MTVAEPSSRVLLLYASQDGQTRKIMEQIGKHLSIDWNVDLYDINDFFPENLEYYHGVMIGAGLRYGYFPKSVVQFTHKYASIINAKKSAFAGICLIARKPEKRSIETNAYLRKFLARSPWRPSLTTAIGGALFYPRYKWYDRLAIRLIMNITGGETDTSKEIEFTDWDQVSDFAQNFHKIMKNEE